MDDTGGGPGAVVDVVGAAVVDDLVAPTRLLAARRTEPPHLAGGWELPGGKVEPGEDPLEALHRELAEELGVEVELGDELVSPEGSRGWPLGLVPAPQPAGPPLEVPVRHRMRVWTARVTAGEPAPIEDHDAVRWLGPGEWFDVAWLPADVPIVQALLARSGHAAPPA